MTRAFVIAAVWICLGALVWGVAQLARPGCGACAIPPAGSAALPAMHVTLAAKAPAPARARTPASEPGGAVRVAEAAVRQERGTVAAPEPARASRASEDGAQQPGTRPDPSDEGGGNHGLGRLPKGVDPEYEGLGIVCILRATGRPIPDVRVRSVTEKEIAAWSDLHPDRSVATEDPEVVLAASTPTKTNTYGIALTPSGPGRMLVDARTGTLYAYAWVDRNTTSQVQLLLVEDHDYVFQARSAEGEPRGGVALVVRDSSCTDVWRGATTESEGLARMRHATFLIERDATPGACTVHVEGVLPSSEPVVLPRGTVSADPFALTVPPSTRLLVRVRDPEGAPVKEPVEVSLGVPLRNDCSRFVTRTARDGEALFERVESGIPGLAITLAGGNVYEPVSQPVQVSARAGEQQIVEARFVRRYPVLQLKLADATGKPAAQARGAAWLEVPAASGPTWIPALEDESLATGADGSVSIPIMRRTDEPRATAVLVALRNALGDWTWSARVPLDPSFTTGVRDAGSVPVEELPLVAQGYVLDERDAPVPGAVVHVAGSDDPSLSPEVFPADERWSAVADARGRFKLRGLVTGARVAVTASAVDHVRPPSLLVRRGDAKVLLRVTRCSDITGKLVLPPRLSADAVRIRLESESESLPVTIGPNQLFRAAGIPPGPTRLQVFVDGIDEAVYTVDDLDVKPGIDINDPRATLIDLRAHILYVTLHVLDPDEKPILDATVEFLEAGDEGPTRSVPVRAGFASFVTRQASVDVEIRAPGFVGLKIPGVDKDAEVRLVRERR